MCIICYKPAGVSFPSYDTLRTCWDNNPDGAGYMFSSDGKVMIRKGFMDFKSFSASLADDIETVGEDSPFVMHFRISTQAGVRQDCCHPFPLSSDMKKLRSLSCTTDIGVAHNGIISMYSDGSKEYSDTMAYITKYLSYLIKGRGYYKNKDSIHLIEETINGSRLAILDGAGHCELIGDWIKDGELYYSCGSFVQKTYANAYYSQYSYYEGFDDYECFEQAFNESTLLYDFKPGKCPWSIYLDSSYCEYCRKFGSCTYQEEIEEDIKDLYGDTDDEK